MKIREPTSVLQRIWFLPLNWFSSAAIQTLHLLGDRREDVVLQCTLLFRGILEGGEDTLLEVQEALAIFPWRSARPN